mgnify:CR=1 FL=1
MRGFVKEKGESLKHSQQSGDATLFACLMEAAAIKRNPRESVQTNATNTTRNGARTLLGGKGHRWEQDTGDVPHSRPGVDAVAGDVTGAYSSAAPEANGDIDRGVD